MVIHHDTNFGYKQLSGLEHMIPIWVTNGLEDMIPIWVTNGWVV